MLDVAEQAQGRATVERVAQTPLRDSWYLDAVAARHKRDANLAFIRRWLPAESPQCVLKTDLFEEANGEDQILLDLNLGQQSTLAFDRSQPTAAQALRRDAQSRLGAFVADCRGLSLRSDSVDLILSTSTLDHMEAHTDVYRSLEELFRVLRPGGRLLLTMDNPWNPVYPLLKLLCRMPGAPFELGYTPSRSRLQSDLERLGFDVLGCDPLVHNPRLVSTALFFALRWGLGSRADRAIAGSLAAFDGLGRLPMRWLSCCFVGVCAVKPR